jgi:hypothetical protein
MRTTLTLDPDVSALLQRLRKRSGARTKQLVNDALRRGLAQMDAPEPEPSPYRTPTGSLGECRLPNLDNVAEVLAVIEGEGFR